MQLAIHSSSPSGGSQGPYPAFKSPTFRYTYHHDTGIYHFVMTGMVAYDDYRQAAAQLLRDIEHYPLNFALVDQRESLPLPPSILRHSLVSLIPKLFFRGPDRCYMASVAPPSLVHRVEMFNFIKQLPKILGFTIEVFAEFEAAQAWLAQQRSTLSP